MLRSVQFLTIVLAAVLGAVIPAHAGVFGSEYAGQGKCGPFARAVVSTPGWACLGIVAGPEDGLVMPRNVLEVSPGRLLLIDMGGWAKNRGRLIEVRIGEDGSRILNTLLSGLDRPHGLALGPDGKVYVGEASVIWRFDPKADKIVRDVVIDNLPDTGRHPLKHFAFEANGDLIVNEGAPSDRCEKVENNFATVQYPCPAIEGDKPQAALWRLHFDKLGGKLASFTPIARGLRNSMAIAIEPKSGLIVQGENNIDFRPENSPPEELNVVKEGGSYGWPYCTSEGVVPDYRRFVKSCAKFEAPAVVVPAHGAPLGMLYYHGAMFPELAGKLIVSLHGYRNNGHRILAYDRAADGRPLAPKGPQPGFPFEVVTGWDARPGVRPQGAPVNISVGAVGQIWFTEDKNRTLMVLMRGQSTANAAGSDHPATHVLPPPPAWTKLSQTISPTCGQCHEDFRARSPLGVWTNLVQRGWITQADLKTSKIVRALQGEAPLKPMPPPNGVDALAGGRTALADFLASH